MLNFNRAYIRGQLLQESDCKLKSGLEGIKFGIFRVQLDKVGLDVYIFDVLGEPVYKVGLKNENRVA